MTIQITIANRQNQTTQTSFVEKHLSKLATLLVLTALLSGAAGLRTFAAFTDLL